MQYTVRAKIRDSAFSSILGQMGEHLGRVRRKFFVEKGILGRSISELKREFIAQERVTARQFNSIAYEIKAMISSQKELKKDLIKKTEKKIKKLKEKTKHCKSKFKLHQFNRKLSLLDHKLKRYKEDLKTPSICFGSKALFKKQFHLSQNKYDSHEDWKRDWKSARDDHFFLIGSKDESFGNQSCQLMPGYLNLRLTHAVAESRGQEWIKIPIQFTYQEERIRLAQAQSRALNYPFIKKENGHWYVHLTFEIDEKVIFSNRNFGALGIDLNPSCIAVTQIDSNGNLSSSWQVPIRLRGKTTEQIEAILGDEIAKIVARAKDEKVPICIEELDFENRKLQLRARSMNRMLSQFSYRKFDTMIQARCFLEGVELIPVNPAYTSTIGKVKFSYGYGLSTHMGAAMAMSRRA